jgi:hypothetical protein
MSTATTTGVLAGRWLPADEMRAIGFEPGGPEIDYGMRWGEERNIRVSYALHGDCPGGYLYAHDRDADRYLLLAAHTTPDQVDAVWRELVACTPSPDAYLAFASLDGAAMPVEQAQQLLLHCLDREMSAHHDFVASGTDDPVRVGAAYAVVVQRSARVAAEDLQVEAVRAANPDVEPVVIRYRVLGDSRWTGRVAGEDLDSTAREAERIEALAGRHELALQATSVSQGHATVAATRVPELAFLARRAEVMPAAPTLAI